MSTQNQDFKNENIIKNLVFDTRQLTEAHKEAAVIVTVESFGKENESKCISLVEHTIRSRVGMVALDGEKVAGLALVESQNFLDGRRELGSTLFCYPIVSEDPSIKDKISIEYLISSIETISRRLNPASAVFATKNKLPMRVVNTFSLKYSTIQKTKGSIHMDQPIYMYEKELNKYHKNVTMTEALKHCA